MSSQGGKEGAIEPRSLYAIAAEVRKDWLHVHYAAEPYLSAMSELDKVDSYFGEDSAHTIVCYFLANASTWRGPVAKRIKAELHQILSAAR